MTQPKAKSDLLKVGRPTKLTQEVVDKLAYAFSIGATVGEACFYSDISRDAYYNWVKSNPKLNDRFQQLKERPVFEARESVIKAFKRDPNLALKYLERKAKAEFSLRTETDLTTKGESINPYAALSIEELKKLAGK